MEAPIRLDVRIGGKGVAPYQGLSVEGAFSRGVATGLTSDGTVGAEARRQEIGALRFRIDRR